MSLEPLVLERAQYWATNSAFDESTHKEIQHLLETKNEKELTDRFYRDLEFGTGGLRGILGAGTARMNLYNIRKATTAFALYLNECFASDKIKIGVTYDSRRYSKEFAQCVAETMAAYDIQTYITKELRPVPMLSYMVREYGCHGGVCITASHNPPNYNGYKVYWQTGGQIVPPHDKAVIKKYSEIMGYDGLKFMEYKTALAKGFVQEVGDELDEKYFARVAALSLQRRSWPGFKIVFTPLHGTAGYPVKTMLKRFGFENVTVVPEQEKPDGNFPTVKFPNPEEKEALAMAVNLARKIDADLVLGTDSDCDRVGIVVKEKGEYVYLNGNQIGSLLIEYVLSSLAAQKRLPVNPLVVKTIVTTDLQNHIGAHYGCHVDETLTGFKWICALIEDYETGRRLPKRTYVCGGEESYGFLMDSFVRDKDGIISCAIAAEMTAYYQSQGKTLSDVLNDVYRRHGVYQESLYTITLPGKEGADRILQMMAKMRKQPPTTIDGIPVDVVRDIKTGKEYKMVGATMSESRALDLPSSDVLQFVLQDGSKISVRPSGTEPKIKFYVSVREAVSPAISASDLQMVKNRCSERVGRLNEYFVSLAESK